MFSILLYHLGNLYFKISFTMYMYSVCVFFMGTNIFDNLTHFKQLSNISQNLWLYRRFDQNTPRVFLLMF